MKAILTLSTLLMLVAGCAGTFLGSGEHLGGAPVSLFR
jgi:hypothetical protein